MCLDLQGQRGETEEEQTGNSAWSDIVPAVLHKHSNASGSEEQMQRCQTVVELALMFNHINGEESRNDWTGPLPLPKVTWCDLVMSLKQQAEALCDDLP